MSKKCVFAGTFDPPTLGHASTVLDAAKVFDEVVVAILINPQKEPMFTLEERKEMLRLLLREVEGVRIVEWEGAAVDLLAKEKTPFYVRGIRNTVDLEYENAACYASRNLDHNMVTVYFPSRQEQLHISSTLVKNSIRFDKPIEELVGENVAKYINEVLAKRGKSNV